VSWTPDMEEWLQMALGDGLPLRDGVAVFSEFMVMLKKNDEWRLEGRIEEKDRPWRDMPSENEVKP